ncbi:hypothetical protein CJU90_0828 [Yarrowia sp. C11]|nr:hypothetical protein CKK34_2238 [Yarrowia sp. E02]KAG5373153.1 hypothetical protein CJU90_0828 [Yarrowia sp. C11]
MAKRIPSSFTSSYRIHENLALENQLDISEKTRGLLSRWITCFLVVQFDVDIGPDLKLIAPRVKFSEQDFHTICFSCLPEKTPVEGELREGHVFRFDDAEGSTLFGYTLFSQRKDPESPRGYTQESLVIISEHYLPRLFITCLEIVVTESYLSTNQTMVDRYPVIETAIELMSKWLDPGIDGDVGFFGDVMSLKWGKHVTHKNEPLQTNHATQTTHITDTIVPFTRFSSWTHLLPLLADVSDLYTLFEAVLLQRHMTIYAASPHLVSSLVSCILDMVHPMVYPYDQVRDYVTIHTQTTDPTIRITGLTNPFLLNKESADDSLLVLLSTSNVNKKLKPRQKYTGRKERVSKKSQDSRESKRKSISSPRDSPRTSITNGRPSNDDSLNNPKIRGESTFSRLRNQISMPSLSSWYDSSPRQTSPPMHYDEDYQLRNQTKKCAPKYLVPDKKFLTDVVTLFNDNQVTDQVIDEYITNHFQAIVARVFSTLSRYLMPVDESFIFSSLDFYKDLTHASKNTYSLRYAVFGRGGSSAPMSSGGRSDEINLICEEEMGLKFYGSGDVSKVAFFKGLVQTEMFNCWVNRGNRA